MQGGAQRGHKMRFDRRSAADDGYGNTIDAWTEVVSVWCGVDTQRRGRGEVLEAGRLQSSIGWKITALKSNETLMIGTDCRGVFLTGPHIGRVVNIRTVEVSADSREIIMDVETGVAV